MEPQTNPIIPGNATNPTPNFNSMPQTNEPAPRTEPETVSLPPNENKSSGPIIGIIIVILLLVGGALYVWKTKLADQITPAPLPTIDQATTALETVGTSSDPTEIENDLINTDLDSLDRDLETLLIEDIQ